MFTEIAHIVPRTSGWRPLIYPSSIIVDSVATESSRDRGGRERRFSLLNLAHTRAYTRINTKYDMRLHQRSSLQMPPDAVRSLCHDTVMT
eukprot:scaffold61618_cov72-Phaeocystis_antarctica.AAC.1